MPEGANPQIVGVMPGISGCRLAEYSLSVTGHLSRQVACQIASKTPLHLTTKVTPGRRGLAAACRAGVAANGRLTQVGHHRSLRSLAGREACRLGCNAVDVDEYGVVEAEGTPGYHSARIGLRAPRSSRTCTSTRDWPPNLDSRAQRCWPRCWSSRRTASYRTNRGAPDHDALRRKTPDVPAGSATRCDSGQRGRSGA